MFRCSSARSLVVSALFVIGVAIGYSQFVLAEAPEAYTFTDQQLLDAGWSEAQIANMRAQSPESSKSQVPMSGSEAASPEKTPVTSPITYTSVFDNYQSFDYLPEIGWREANDTVGKIGGWRSYAKLVQEAQKREALANQEGDKK